jgi:hypothetical protein
MTMMRAEVTGNAIEVSFSRSEALLLVLSAVMVVTLGLLGGWDIALTALGLSLFGAMAVDLVQRPPTGR